MRSALGATRVGDLLAGLWLDLRSVALCVHNGLPMNLAPRQCQVTLSRVRLTLDSVKCFAHKKVRV